MAQASQEVAECPHPEFEFQIVGAIVFIRCTRCPKVAQLRMDGETQSHFTTIGAHIAMRARQDTRLDISLE